VPSLPVNDAVELSASEPDRRRRLDLQPRGRDSSLDLRAALRNPVGGRLAGLQPLARSR
jgi:hypothetical protein